MSRKGEKARVIISEVISRGIPFSYDSLISEIKRRGGSLLIAPGVRVLDCLELHEKLERIKYSNYKYIKV